MYIYYVGVTQFVSIASSQSIDRFAELVSNDIFSKDIYNSSQPIFNTLFAHLTSVLTVQVGDHIWSLDDVQVFSHNCDPVTPSAQKLQYKILSYLARTSIDYGSPS